MIILKELLMQDFLSHEDTRLSFKDGQRVLIEGKSGSGKSSILDAVVWCLYGKGRVDNRNLVRQTGKKATVELTLKDGGREFRVIRKATNDGKNTLSVEELGDADFAPIPVAGAKNIQDWIEKELVKASYQLFINSVSYPQDNAENFVKQVASKRKELLLEIAGTENYDVLAERAKSKLSLVSEALQRLQGELSALGNDTVDITSLATQHLELQLRTMALEEEIKEKTAFLDEKRGQIAELKIKQASLKTVVAERDSLVAEIASLTSQLEHLDKQLTGLKQLPKPEGDQAGLMTEISAIQQKLLTHFELQSVFKAKRAEIESLIRNKPIEQPFEDEIKKINAQIIQAMKDTKSLCDLGESCKNHVSVVKAKMSFLEEQLQDRSVRLADQNKRLSEYAAKVRDLSESMPPEPSSLEMNELVSKKNALERQLKAIGEFEETKNKMQVIAEEMGKKEVQVQEKKMQLEKRKVDASLLEGELALKDVSSEEIAFNNVSTELMSCRAEKEGALAAQSRINSEIERAKKQESRMKELKDETTKLAHRKAALELVKEAFGSKGIKTLVIDVLIPKLETSINEILSQLSDFRVSLNTLKASTSGENFVEGLFINIIDPQGNEMDFASYSGGEKLKIIVAISEALASLQRVGFRLLDELFVGLDEASTEGFLAVLEKIQSRFSQVLCITHLQQIKDAFTDKIEVIKLNGVSQIV